MELETEIAELEAKYEAATKKWSDIRVEISRLKKEEQEAMRVRDAVHGQLTSKMREALGK